MIAILAVNNLGFIGKDNELMWRSSEDLKHFKNMTLDKFMIVGHNTFQTLPKVVKERNIWVAPRIFNHDLENEALKQNIDLSDFICIGGKKTYEQHCHLFTELHISHINDNQIGDCTFPDFSNLNPNCVVFNYYFEVNS